jgi:hypothetical protein
MNFLQWFDQFSAIISLAGVAFQLAALTGLLYLRRTDGKRLKGHWRDLIAAARQIRDNAEKLAERARQVQEQELLVAAKCHALGIAIEVEKGRISP